MKELILSRQGVKLLIACLLPLMTISVAHSQINYGFTVLGSSYTANSGGTEIIPAGTDDALSAATPIGFTFKYNCNTYTQFIASSNGWLSLGNTATQSLPNNALNTTGQGPIIAPLWDNLATAGNLDSLGDVNYVLSGTAPNRILTVEWLHMLWNYQSPGPVMTFQVKLYENGTIDFNYFKDSRTINLGSASVGISGGVIATDFYSLDSVTATPIITYGSEPTIIKARPARGYRWTPQNMAYQSATTAQMVTGLISACTPSQAVVRVDVSTLGCKTPLNLTELQFSMNGSTSVSDFSKVHIYYTGNSAVYSASGEFVSGGITPALGTIIATGSQTLLPGTNYFWIAYDVNVGTATAGDAIDAECTQMTIGGVTQVPTVTAPTGSGTFTSCSVSPGGISGMSYWIKTTNGVPTSTDGTSIASWSDQSGFGRTATSPASGNYPTYRDNSASNVNFNPVVEFNDAAQNPAAADYLTVGANGLLAPSNNNYSVYAVIKPGSGNTSTPGQFLFAGTSGANNSSAFGIGSTNSFSDTWTSNDLVVNNAWTTGTPALASFNYDGTQRNLYVGGNLAGSLPLGTVRNSGDINDAIGARYNGSIPAASEFFSGSIAEIVSYPNTSHSAAARNKIESYLGIKYGISLQHDYISASGTTVWSTSTNPAYNTNITGIGRDDNSGLIQKQGKSSSASGDMLTVYIGSSKTVNQSANTGTFASGDQSFFMIANNGVAFAYSGNNGPGEQPSGITSRLQREWLARKTNFTNTDLTLEFDFNAISGTFAGQLHAADLRLLTDNDGDFTNATIIGSPTATITVNGAVVTVTVPASSFGANTYFTLASAAATSTLPVTLSGFNAACKSNKIQLTWTKLSTSASTYNIERSNDGRSFTKVAAVTSNTSGEQTYGWVDPSPLSGVSYYRLQVVDENGFTSYSTIATVNGCSTDVTRIASDPVSGQPTLVMQLQQSASVDISLFDVLGHRIDVSGLTGKHSMLQGLYRLPVAQQNLASGLYLLSVTINGNKNVFRIVQP